MSWAESVVEVWDAAELQFQTGIKSSEIHAKKKIIYSSGVKADTLVSKQKTNLMSN